MSTKLWVRFGAIWQPKKEQTTETTVININVAMGLALAMLINGIRYTAVSVLESESTLGTRACFPTQVSCGHVFFSQKKASIKATAAMVA